MLSILLYYLIGYAVIVISSNRIRVLGMWKLKDFEKPFFFTKREEISALKYFGLYLHQALALCALLSYYFFPGATLILQNALLILPACIAIILL